MTVEALIFDLGNVVVPFEWQIAEDQLRPRCANGTAGAREEIAGIATRFELGELTQELFVRKATRALGFQGEEREFIAIWNSIFRPNPPMEQTIIHLKASFPLFLLSNTSELHLAYLKQHFDVLRNFVDGVYSFRAKSAKPDRKIFEIAVKQFGVKPERTVYIDDLVPNVRSALDLGFQAIQYDLREHGEFERQLAEFGI